MTTNTSGQKGTTAAEAFTIFLLVQFGVLSLCIYLLIGYSVKTEFYRIEMADHQREAKTLADMLESFVTDRYTIIKDYSSFPVITQTIMQLHVKRATITDFMAGLSVLGHKYQLVLVDFEGHTVYSTMAAPQFNYAAERWITPLLSGEKERFTGISQVDNEFYFRIASPIVYNNHPEGILIAEIPINEFDKVYNLNKLLVKAHLVLTYGNITVFQAGTAEKGPYTVVDLPKLGLTLSFVADSGDIVKTRNDLLFRTFVILGCLLLMAIYGGIKVGSKAFIYPLQKLTDRATSLAVGVFVPHSPSRTSIDEILVLEKNFDTMAISLLEAQNTLEARVRERTEELNLEKTRVELIVKGIADGVIVVNTNQEILLINQIALSLFSYPIEITKNLPLDVFFCRSGVDDAEFNLSKEDIPAGGGRFSLDIDNSTTILDVSLAPFYNEKGQSSGLVYIFRDITKEKEIDRMKTEFIANVSHELRTPLASIKGFSSTLRMDRTIDEDVRDEFLEIIDEESERLNQLIEDLLNISRIESGNISLKKERVSFNDIILKTEKGIRTQFDDKGVSLSVTLWDNGMDVMADLNRMIEVVQNLLSNSLKFTPKGGSVEVVGKIVEEHVVIEINDTGIGIPKKDLAHVFEKFYRVYRPGKEIQGTGLGLHIVKSIVEESGGTIMINSNKGDGTSVVMRFASFRQLDSDLS